MAERQLHVNGHDDAWRHLDAGRKAHAVAKVTLCMPVRQRSERRSCRGLSPPTRNMTPGAWRRGLCTDTSGAEAVSHFRLISET